jgi:multidrug efflux pump subunit AcrA (membrane-fusion protein)
MDPKDSQTNLVPWSQPDSIKAEIVDVDFLEEQHQLQLQRRRWRTWVFVSALLITAGGGGLWYWQQTTQSPSPAIAQPKGLPPRPIETVKLQTGRGAQTIQLAGEVNAPETTTLRSQTSGVVRQMFVNIGDPVQAGQTIAILDAADQQLALAQAQAELAEAKSNLAMLTRGTRPEVLAQRRAALSAAQAQEAKEFDNLKRSQELADAGALSQRLLIEAQTEANTAKGNRLEAAAELAEATAGPLPEQIDAQRANVAAAQARVNQVKLTLQRTQVRAATDGIVSTRTVSVGDYVQNGGELITFVDRAIVDIFLEVPETYTGQINLGQSVTLRSRALPDWVRSAAITGLVPVANNQSRRQLVRVRLTNPPADLLPGMAIQAELKVAAPQGGFVVARDTLTRRADQWLVFKIAQGKAQQIEVELLSDMGKTALIQSNQLQPGDDIVLRGGDGLQDGAAVNVVKGAKPQSR